MDTNFIVFEFVKNNYILILLILLFLAPVIPPEYAGYWKYNLNNKALGRAKRISLLRYILHFLIDSVFVEILVNGMTTFQFKPAITFIIFLVMGFDIFFRHQISQQAITLVSIGIVVLYLERLIEIGKHIKLFWGLLEWRKDDDVQLVTPNLQPNQTEEQKLPVAAN
jgi:hypothetical protein